MLCSREAYRVRTVHSGTPGLVVREESQKPEGCGFKAPAPPTLLLLLCCSQTGNSLAAKCPISHVRSIKYNVPPLRHMSQATVAALQYGKNVHSSIRASLRLKDSVKNHDSIMIDKVHASNFRPGRPFHKPHAGGSTAR